MRQNDARILLTTEDTNSPPIQSSRCYLRNTTRWQCCSTATTADVKAGPGETVRDGVKERQGAEEGFCLLLCSPIMYPGSLKASHTQPLCPNNSQS